MSSLRWNAGIRGREPSMCEPVGLELQLHLHWTKGTDVCPIAVMLGPPHIVDSQVLMRSYMGSYRVLVYRGKFSSEYLVTRFN